MPLFHIHLRNRHTEAADREGHDLPDLDAARGAAIAGVREFLGHEVIAMGKLDLRGHVDIESEDGDVLTTIRFDEVVLVTQDT